MSDQFSFSDLYNKILVTYPQPERKYCIDHRAKVLKDEKGHYLFKLCGKQKYYLALWESQMTEMFATLTKEDLEGNQLCVASFSKENKTFLKVDRGLVKVD